MSQTETLLLFVLGFCVALFVVLLFGRGVWAMFGSWSGWRELRRQPAAILELEAERDGLKAEKAMMAQKLEASISDMKMRMAEQMAEVSRNRNRLLDTSQTLKEREATISHLSSQLDDRTAAVTSLQTQIEENVKSINLAYAKMAQREEEHGKMQLVLKEAQSTLMMRDEKIGNLVEETKALREIATNYVSNPFNGDGMTNSGSDNRRRSKTQSVPVLAAPLSTDTFESFPANANSGNPLVHVEQLMQANGETLRFENSTDELEGFKEIDNVDRSVSNVLSLAERVRSLQSGMKKI
jgi:chromosome segregation ATPase